MDGNSDFNIIYLGRFFKNLLNISYCLKSPVFVSFNCV